MNNQVEVQKPKSVSSLNFSQFMTAEIVRKKVNEMLGGTEGQKFITSIISSVVNNPALSECDNMTIFNSALIGASLNLSPSPQLGQFYMVPFKNKGTGKKEAQFQLGYKGYIQLAIRSGQYKKLNVIAIKEGELVNYDPLNEEIEVNLIDDEIERENAKTIGYYAMFEYVNGFRKTIYWSKEKTEKHALTYSQGYKTKKGYTFWEKDFDGMAFKTLLRQLISKWGVMSIEMQTAYENDMGVIREDSKIDYVDNIQETKIIEEPEEEKPTPKKAKEVKLNEL